MAYFLSPVCNSQIFDANGNPLVGGKVYTYLAGTTTPAATYTDNTGATPQANPITLNSLGLPASPIWLLGGIPLKFVIKDTSAVTLETIDNVSGVNDANSTTSEWVPSGFVPTFISATSFSVGGDQTGTLHVGRRLKTTNTAGTVYSTILTVVYSSVTTITVSNDSTVLDSGLSAVSYGVLDSVNESIPAVLNNITTFNGGSPFGFKNRIINGAMEVAQYATTSTTQGYSTVDRWYVNRSGGVAGLTIAQVYGAFSTTKTALSLWRDAGNASTAALGAYQSIEGRNCRDLAGSSVTVSFLVGTGANVTTTGHSVTLYYQTTTTDIGPTSGSWTTIASSAFTVTASTGFTAKSATFSVPSNATQLQAVISFAVTGTAGADDRFYLTEVQLEKGSTATVFDRRDYGRELIMCQRYYWKLSSDIRIFGYNSASGEVNQYISFFTPMRVSPTVTSTSGAASAASIGITNIGIGGFTVQVIALSGGVFYMTYTAGNSASAELV